MLICENARLGDITQKLWRYNMIGSITVPECRRRRRRPPAARISGELAGVNDKKRWLKLVVV